MPDPDHAHPRGGFGGPGAGGPPADSGPSAAPRSARTGGDAGTGGGTPEDAGTVAYPPASSWPTGRLLSAAARRVERAWDLYLEQWHLSHASVPVLVVLTRGPLSQREIAGQMHVTEQTLGRVLRGLEEHGYITREPHASDRRRRLVTLTEHGREALVELDHAREVQALIGNELTDDETAQLRRLLIQMLGGLPLPERRDKV